MTNNEEIIIKISNFLKNKFGDRIITYWNMTQNIVNIEQQLFSTFDKELCTTGILSINVNELKVNNYEEFENKIYELVDIAICNNIYRNSKNYMESDKKCVR